MTNHVDKHDKAFQVDIASYALPHFIQPDKILYI